MEGLSRQEKHTIYMRKWRINNPEKAREINTRYKRKKRVAKEGKTLADKEAHKRWNINNPDKVRVYSAVFIKTRQGEIAKPDTCSLCEATNVRIEGHHFDYSKPLELTWLCYGCHRMIHSKERGHDAE